MNIKAIIATGTLATALICGAASAQTISLPSGIAVNSANSAANPKHVRGERGSRHNLASERKHLERIIDQLQKDRHDYGGHREQAIDLLTQARNQLLAAEEYDKAHPGQ